MVHEWLTGNVHYYSVNGPAGEGERWRVVRRDRRRTIATDAQPFAHQAKVARLRLNLGLSHLLGINIKGERAEGAPGLRVLARPAEFSSKDVPTSANLNV